VLDLGIITAGAATAACLADFGAEVIKIESRSYRDPFRRWLSEKPPDATDDLPPFFRATNRNKLGLSLDLKHELGRSTFLRLAAHSDVVVENFRRGVLQKLGLDYEALRAANPNIILASISSQGETGPEAQYVSYGSTLEAVAGLAWTTGYRDGDPTITGVDLNYPDQVVGLFATSMIVTAWLARMRGGGGAHLDMSQRELTSFLSGEAFVASSDGQQPGREGNAQHPHALQECHCAADGRWLAVTVDRPQLAALCRLLSHADAGVDLPRIEASLAAWIGAREAAACVAPLAACGVAAAVVFDAADVLRGEGTLWSDALQRSPQGHMVKGFAHQLRRSPLQIAREAPTLGADSEAVLRRIAGLTDDEIEALRMHGVI
jgi:crotonobetainyl-CoA:carnitine CoA-transferase CaiB-like acyl-CoA transferase